MSFLPSKQTPAAVLVLAAVALLVSPGGRGQEPADLGTEATSSLAASARDFRGSAWGASEAEVRKMEKNPLVARDEGAVLLLGYSGRLLGRECRFVYRFVDDMLAGGYYILEGEGLPRDFLVHFEKCSRELTRNHGPATQDQVLWSDMAPGTSRPDLEDALWAGQAHRRAIWDRPPTSITLSLRSVDGPANLKLILLYESLLLKPLAEQAQEQARQSPHSDIMR